MGPVPELVVGHAAGTRTGLRQTRTQVRAARAFETDFIDTPGRSYAVSPDGQRLLVVKRAEPDRTTAIQVLSNWTAIRD